LFDSIPQSGSRGRHCGADAIMPGPLTPLAPADYDISQALADQRRSIKSIWFLYGSTGGTDSRCVPVTSDPFTIGRRVTCSLCLQCASVSSCHAELFTRDGDLWLRDRKSTNGTFKNGVRVTGEVPVEAGDLLQFSTHVFRVVRHQAVRSDVTSCEDVCDQAMALVLLDRLLEEGSVIPYYQPIVQLDDEKTIGLEVLCRSSITTLESPAKIFSAAAQLGLEIRLSETIRMQAAHEVRSLDENLNLFLNTHPAEVGHSALIGSMRTLRQVGLERPLTLEIHEAAASDPVAMRSLRDALQEIDVYLAFDDFGAGQARLTELCEVQPRYVKFDMNLIRGLHKAPQTRQQMVATLVRMTRDLGILTLAEGIECREEADACIAMGFELAQGFFFGRPAPLRQR
jgi:EAL domain-containing protein (putative c-di-GMP-specific phosphodiesterase class I)